VICGHIRYRLPCALTCWNVARQCAVGDNVERCCAAKIRPAWSHGRANARSFKCRLMPTRAPTWLGTVGDADRRRGHSAHIPAHVLPWLALGCLGWRVRCITAWLVAREPEGMWNGMRSFGQKSVTTGTDARSWTKRSSSMRPDSHTMPLGCNDYVFDIGAQKAIGHRPGEADKLATAPG
jgi:hypothetical protein